MLVGTALYIVLFVLRSKYHSFEEKKSLHRFLLIISLLERKNITFISHEYHGSASAPQAVSELPENMNFCVIYNCKIDGSLSVSAILSAVCNAATNVPED